jgi:membrane-associated protease RseP (regulator of RpoE activity)
VVSLVLALFLLTGPVVAEEPAKAAKPIVVPLEILASKHLAVQVKVNGKGPYRLIFDTGAPMVLLSNKAANESGVVPKDAGEPLFTMFGAKGQFPADKFDVGGATVAKMQVIVMDHPTVALLAKAVGPIDGIVGYPFFARYKTTIDYQAKQLTLVPTDYEPEDVLETMLNKLLTARRSPPVLAAAGQWGLAVTKKQDDEAPGVTIAEVRPGSAAAAAGLKVGDRLLTIDGRWTDSVADCYQAASTIKPDQAAAVVYVRDGKENKVTVKPRMGL